MKRLYRTRLVNHFVYSGLFVTGSGHDVLVVGRDVAAQHRRGLLRLQKELIWIPMWSLEDSFLHGSTQRDMVRLTIRVENRLSSYENGAKILVVLS